MYAKICSVCKKDKDIEDFHFNDLEKGTRKSKCKTCQADYIKKYKSRDPEKLKDIWRKASRRYINYDIRRNKTLKKYGLDINSYNKIYDDQNGKCKICSDKINLCVDHCHSTGKVRGLLCNFCNTGLGSFKNNELFLLNAIEYIKNSKIV